MKKVNALFWTKNNIYENHAYCYCFYYNNPFIVFNIDLLFSLRTFYKL